MESEINMGLILASFALFLITIYYALSKRFAERHVGLIMVSFFQGIALSQILLRYHIIIDDSLEALVNSPIIALSYYIIFKYLWNVVMVIKTVRGKTEDYKDEELIKSLEDIEDFHGLEFELKKYSGEKSFNAFVIPPIPFFRKKYTISFGEELIESFTLGEKLFVIAHEIAHAIDKHVHKRALLFFLVFFLLLVFSLLLNIFVIKNAVEYFVQFYLLYNLVLLLIGIIGIDLVSWRYEYKADEKALELTKDFTSFKSAFLKFEEKKPARDFGKIINLIVYDHPLIKNRIEKRKLLIEGK